MARDRLPLSPGAQALLEEHKQRTERVIANQAEFSALREGRSEISENDIKSITRVSPLVTGTKRKFAIRIGTIFVVATLILQLSCLIELQNASLWLLARFLIPWAVFLTWFGLVSYFFRDEWA